MTVKIRSSALDKIFMCEFLMAVLGIQDPRILKKFSSKTHKNWKQKNWEVYQRLMVLFLVT